MAIVYVFISTGRFHSVEEIRAFVDMTYTDDGEGVPSAFIREVELVDFEPGCIEAHFSQNAVPLSELLAGTSWSDQWLPQLDGARKADAAICVFDPNKPLKPENCSMEYLGGFEHAIVFEEWFKRLLATKSS